MFLFLIILILLYAGFLSLILTGIVRLKLQSRNKKLSELPFVKIVIPFRNEADNLPFLIHDIEAQIYPADKLKIILVNDHSDDGSSSFLQEKLNGLKKDYIFLDLPSDKKGKKSAISLGISKADKNDILLSTDADCRLPESWVSSMAVNLEIENANMILGPVVMKGKSFIGMMQESESISLLSVTMGFAGLNVPILSNGANIMYRKSDVNEKDDPYKRDISSGDDMFLMDYLLKQNKKIVFNDSASALVTTESTRNLKEFLQQRSRWLRKTKHYNWGLSKITAVFFALIQFSFVLAFILLILKDEISLLFSLLLFKMVYDILIFIVTKYRLNLKSSILYFTLFSLIYPFWTIFTSLFSYLIKPVWKGRKINN